MYRIMIINNEENVVTDVPMKMKDAVSIIERIDKEAVGKGSSHEKVFATPVAKTARRFSLDMRNGFLGSVGLYISEHCGEIITMRAVAEHMNMNKDYFGKLFKSRTGITFNVFYTHVKIECAKELLASGKYKTYEVSDLLGYSSVDYFSKIFKSVTGTTPTSFRRNEA